MDPTPEGSYIGLVVRVEEMHGSWSIAVDGSAGALTLPLQPATFILRLWRTEDGQVIRGTIGLHGDEEWAPLQTNVRIEQIVRHWLVGGGSSSERP